MSQRATATFTITKWDEQPYEEFDGGRKLSRAHVGRAYTGDLEGSSTDQSLMFYREDGSANYLGFERFIGTLAGKVGSFVIQGDGTFAGGVASTKAFIVPGSGTGELSGLRGTVTFESGHADRYPITIDYEL